MILFDISIYRCPLAPAPLGVCGITPLSSHPLISTQDSRYNRVPHKTHAHQEFYGGRFSVHALENKTQKEKAWNSSIQEYGQQGKPSKLADKY